MNPEFENKGAIDFLALVREDLEYLGSLDTPLNVTITPSYKSSDFETISSIPDFVSTSHLGRFEIIEQIGEGGFARVFVASDPNLEREVALKVPKPHVLVSKEARFRFEREAKSAAILSHPNIVPVFESGSAGPICYIASEYCPGPDLRIWFAQLRKKPSPRTAAGITSCLADALQHAHRRGIIHRDLKPSNVIVIDGDEDVTKRLRITDFGLARQVSCEETLTANGAIIGTPAYMSPEQAEGIGKVDHRSDVYSLGMVLYELLTGKVPFKRSSHIASIAAVIHEPVPPPSQYNSRVNADLEAVCLKALEKEPDARYQSAYDFKCDLQRWLNGNEVSARPLSQTGLFQRWIKRNPVIAAAVLFSTICLGVGFAFSFVQWKEAQRNLTQSIQQRDRAEKNVNELHKTIVNALEISLDSLEKQPQQGPGQQEILDQFMDAHIRLIEEEAEEVEITPSTFESYERLARIYRITGRYKNASEICARADKLLEPCLANKATRKKFALSASHMALQKWYIASEQGDQGTAFALLNEAERYFLESESGVDRVKWLEDGYYLYRLVGFAHVHRGEQVQGLTAFETSGAMAIEALDLNPDDEQLRYNFAKSFVDMSHLFQKKEEDWHIGLEYLERAEQLFEEGERRFLTASEKSNSGLTADDYKYRLAYIRNEIALFLRRHMEDYERAEEYNLRAIESLEELVADNPGQLGYQNRLSHAIVRRISIYYEQGMFDEALDLIEESMDVHRKGKTRRAEERIALCENFRGRIWAFEYGEPELAEASFDRAIEVIESSDYFHLGDDLLVDSLIETHRLRGVFYSKTGQFEKSMEATAEGYRLAIQRALEYPTELNVETALKRGKYYGDRLFKNGQHKSVKAVLDTTAEATKDSANAQYDLAHRWARYDSLQRDQGVERNIWKSSRNRSMRLLSRAIDLGFDDHDRIQEARYLKEYQLLPEFKSICNRIKPKTAQ